MIAQGDGPSYDFNSNTIDSRNQIRVVEDPRGIELLECLKPESTYCCSPRVLGSSAPADHGISSKAKISQQLNIR